MKSNSKIRVMHVVTSLDTGGMENGIINLCNRHTRTLFEPSVCCLRSAGTMSERLKSDVDLFCMDFSNGNVYTQLFKLSRLFKAKQPHIVHTHGFGGGSLYGILSAKLAKVPVIINGEHGALYLKSHQVIIQKVLSSMCDATLAVSESLKKKIIQKKLISNDNIVVINNGVNTDLFTGAYDCSCLGEGILKKYRSVTENGGTVICSIGSLKAEKNQIILLKALKKIKQSKIDKEILSFIVGAGKEFYRLKRYVLENDLQNDVIFLGKRDDIPQLLSTMDLLISTSISSHEGMSNVILEAFSSGIPVIATGSTGTSELIRDGVNGFLIKNGDILSLADKIALFVNNSHLKHKMGKNARINMKNEFSLNKMVGEYEKKYFKLLGYEET